MAYVYRPKTHRGPMDFPTLGFGVQYDEIVDIPELEEILASNPDFQKVEDPKKQPTKKAAAGDENADGTPAADPAAEQTGAGDAGRS